MSGIEQMKAKIKKKMTLNDLPAPDNSNNLSTNAVHSAVHSEVSTVAHTAVQPNVQTAIHTDVHPDTQQYVHTSRRFIVNTDKQQNSETEIPQYSNTLNHENRIVLDKDEHINDTGTQYTVNTAIQHDVQQPVGTLKQQNSNAAASMEYNNTLFQQADNHSSESFQPYNERGQHNVYTGIQQLPQQHSNTAIHQSKSQYPKKMTIYLTEELYKTFNDIYAQRMLEGRKTEKSELICEAVRLLDERERINKRSIN